MALSVNEDLTGVMDADATTGHYRGEQNILTRHISFGYFFVLFHCFFP